MELRHGHHGGERAAAAHCELAFHLHPRRQWYGDLGITQAELAEVAGVSRRFITHVENACELQASVEATLRVALALGYSVEELIAPNRVAKIAEEVAQRRTALEGRRAQTPRRRV